MGYFKKIKHYLVELGYFISQEDSEEQLFVINDDARGIVNMVLDVEDDLLVLEQHVLDLAHPDSAENLRQLLQINRTTVHGAFALDESGKRVSFRDALQVQNLDLNELEASLNAVGLALAEHHEDLLAMAAPK